MLGSLIKNKLKECKKIFLLKKLFQILSFSSHYFYQCIPIEINGYFNLNHEFLLLAEITVKFNKRFGGTS